MTALNFDTVANAEDRATVHYTVPKNGTKTSGTMGGLLNSRWGTRSWPIAGGRHDSQRSEENYCTTRDDRGSQVGSVFKSCDRSHYVK